MLIFLRRLRINRRIERERERDTSNIPPSIYFNFRWWSYAKKRGTKTSHLQTRFDQISRATAVYRIRELSVQLWYAFNSETTRQSMYKNPRPHQTRIYYDFVPPLWPWQNSGYWTCIYICLHGLRKRGCIQFNYEHHYKILRLNYLPLFVKDKL